MQADKKKLIIVGVLGVVVLSVGAFQFLGSAPPAPAPAPAKKVETKELVADASVTAPKNPLFDNPLAIRDPFEPPASEKPKAPEVIKPASPPSTMSGKLPPVDIGGPIGGGSFGGDKGNTPVIMAEPKFDFTYTVSGVMLGAKPLVIFSDAQGNQRIVPLGGSIDADTTVLHIEKQSVNVRFHGKSLRLTVEGNPNDK